MNQIQSKTTNTKLYYKLETNKSDHKNLELVCSVYIKTEWLYRIRLLFLRKGEEKLNRFRFAKFSRAPLIYKISTKLGSYENTPKKLEEIVRYINQNIEGLWNISLTSTDMNNWLVTWSFESKNDLIAFKLKFG